MEKRGREGECLVFKYYSMWKETYPALNILFTQLLLDIVLLNNLHTKASKLPFCHYIIPDALKLLNATTVTLYMFLTKDPLCNHFYVGSEAAPRLYIVFPW